MIPSAGATRCAGGSFSMRSPVTIFLSSFAPAIFKRPTITAPAKCCASSCPPMKSPTRRANSPTTTAGNGSPRSYLSVRPSRSAARFWPSSSGWACHSRSTETATSVCRSGLCSGPSGVPTNADSADDYARAIDAAKVCLGLLSKGNRDQHTTRSMEIPSLGGLLCAERTPEHLGLYEEDHEAVFWDTPEECATNCFALLADPERREAIAAAGRQRYLKNPWRNMAVVQAILNAAMAPSGGPDLSPSSDEGSGTRVLRDKLPLEAGIGPADVYVNHPSTR